MFHQLIFITMLSLLSSFAVAQNDLVHYYLKIDGKDTLSFKVSYGLIDYDVDYEPKKRELIEIQSDTALIQHLFMALNAENTEDHMTIFIHGLWADTRVAWEQMVKNASRDIFENGSGQKKVLLSIIWDSAFDYSKGLKIACNKGDYLSSFLKTLIQVNDNQFKINFVCHSMGNRIIQHMINEGNLIENKKMVINHFISVAADLESNIFEEGQPLHGLEKIVQDISIYIHNNDRTLKMSRLINNNDRLGLNGLPDIIEMPSNFRTIDVSTITDNADFASRMSNHRYFYMSPSIKKDIQRVLYDKDFITSKKELKHPRKLKLTPAK